MTTNYILRLRQLIETVRKLDGPGHHSPAVEEQLAELERDLQQAATEMTIQACRHEVERRAPAGERRRENVPVAVDRRRAPTRRSADLPEPASADR